MFIYDDKFRAVDPLEMERFLNGEQGVRDVFDSRLLQALERLTNFTEYRVSYPDKWRPDLIAYQVYGSTQYWWILMFVNGFQTPSDLKPGTVVRCPIKEEVDVIVGEVMGRELTHL